MPASITDRIQRGLGLARSLVIYRRPGRQGALRRLYRPMFSPGDLVFDIGAHLGDRTAAFAALGARVVAVEPQPHIMRWLRRLEGGKANVILVEEAVGQEPGTAELALSYRTPTVASLAAGWRQQLQQTTSGFRGVSWQEGVRVPVTTLDALIDQYGLPAFCKIDVEGYEAEVLAGLSRPVQALSMEFVNGALDQSLRCLDELERLGNYEFNVIAGEGRHFRWGRWQNSRYVRDWLASGADGISSGDIYTRLQ